MIKIPADFLRLYAIVVGIDSRFIDEEEIAIYAERGFKDYNDILNFIVVSDEQKLINNIKKSNDSQLGREELNKLSEALTLKRELPPISTEVANKLNELLSKIFDSGIKEKELEKIFNSISTILISAMQLKLPTESSRDNAENEFKIIRAGFYIIGCISTDAN